MATDVMNTRVTVSEAALLLGVRGATVRRAADARLLKRQRDGRFKLADIIAYNDLRLERVRRGGQHKGRPTLGDRMRDLRARLGL